ncbi:hypothetical protein C8J56DRAFT_145243 [Mycena floridula]|nr:hypothetical protein C8J56DRAFT_145243 [Mycena floridula]
MTTTSMFPQSRQLLFPPPASQAPGSSSHPVDDRMDIDESDGLPEDPCPEKFINVNIKELYRSNRYICRPVKKSPWWPENDVDAQKPWIMLNMNIASYSTRLQRLEDKDIPFAVSGLTRCLQQMLESGDVFSCMEFLDNAHVMLTTASPDDSSGRSHFADIYSLGPYGVSPLIDFLFRVFHLVEEHSSAIPVEIYETWYPVMARECNRLEFLQSTWREIIPNNHDFAPDGFRDLFEVFRLRSGLSDKLAAVPRSLL